MKYAWIEHPRGEYTVSRLCLVLSVSRSGYCQWRVRAPSARALANQTLDAKVTAIHRDSRRSYGRPRITRQLRQQGECVTERFGVGPQTAAVLMAVAGDNPERLRNESSLAALCGVSPLQASSGKTVRHRLNRGGDRCANNALWTIAMVRMRSDPRTHAYVERRTKEGL